MVPLRIVWSWRARAVASGLAAASAAITVWAAVAPKSPASTVIFCGLVAAVTAGMALETYVYRVDGDAAGLRRRSLRGTDTLAWEDVRGVRLVDTRDTGLAVVHTRTGNLGAAFHVQLLTQPHGAGPHGSSLRGPASRRPWRFNAWMSGYDELRRLVAARGWAALDEPLAEVDPRTAKVIEGLDAVNEIGRQIVWGFALLFMTFMASVGLVDLDLRRDFFLDVALVAGALLMGAALVDALLKWFGGRAAAQAYASPGERRTLWMIHAASLIGGVLFLAMFVPRALAGGPDVWVDWVLVGFGALALFGALRP